MKCQWPGCGGSIVSEPGYYQNPARHKCLSCGRDVKMEEEKKEEERALCKVCGKPTYSGHHHVRSKRVSVPAITETSRDVPTKFCSGCGQDFPATKEFFHASKKGRLGFNSKCKECKSKRSKKRRSDSGPKKETIRLKNDPSKNVTPEQLFKAVRRSIADEIVGLIRERFA